jgi:hypothetical protein
MYPLSNVILNGSRETGQDEYTGTHLDCCSCYTYTEKKQVIKYNNILFTSILQYKMEVLEKHSHHTAKNNDPV